MDIASRTESAGGRADQRLGSRPGPRSKAFFEFEPRGSVEAENKDRLNMFYLNRLRPDLS